MKPKVLLASLSLIPFCALWAADPVPQEPENLPELPTTLSLETPAAAPERTLLPSDFTPSPDTAPSARRMPTAEELEKLRKDRNWMVEGMKEKQAADAKAQSRSTNSTTLQNPDNLDMSQSIIDMVLNKKQKTDPQKAAKTNLGTQERNRVSAEKRAESKPGDSAIPTFQPVIATNSFDHQTSPRSSGENALTNSLLQQERSKANRAGFKDPQFGSAMQDPLNNPFANLPIPEDALPRSQPPSFQASRPGPDLTPAPNSPTAGGGNPWLNNNNMSGNMASAAGPGNPANQGMPSSLVVNNPAPSGPRMAVEQPYAILREQELIRQLQQNNNNRPKVQDLRGTVRDPNEVRLF